MTHVVQHLPVNREPQACVVEDCTPIKGAHRLTGCTNENCRGCLPREAEPGLVVCTADRLRITDRITELGLGAVHAANPAADSRTLPSLYDALLQPSTVASITRGGDSDEQPATLNDDALLARTAIASMMQFWAGQLVEHWASANDPEHPDLRVRKTRPHSASTVPAWTAFILTHVHELLADPARADRLAYNVDTVYVDARRRAYPQPPRGYVIGSCPVRTPEGPCGGEVRAIVDSAEDEGWAICRTCKTKASIDYWLAIMPANQTEWLAMQPLRWHLTIHAGRKVSDNTIRSWARDPATLPARTLGVWPHPAAPRHDLVGRVEYRVADAVELAKEGRRRGRPPRPRPPVDSGAGTRPSRTTNSGAPAQVSDDSELVGSGSP